MTTIVNDKGETVAYLYLTIILDVSQSKVLGLILGNCVFGQHTAPIGKFFKDTFRKQNGKIVAKLGKEVFPKKPADEKKVLADAWTMLSNVREHVCMWVEENEKWTQESFTSFLAVHEARALAV